MGEQPALFLGAPLIHGRRASACGADPDVVLEDIRHVGHEAGEEVPPVTALQEPPSSIPARP